MSDNGAFTIRPAGRHILTIGRDLIHDQYAAIVELVKNAYDADSADAIISFKISDDRECLTIIVQDHGHGMEKNTVIKKWLVPSTDDKLKREVSPKGRIMQGRKGIGRYAASILGNDLLLETITPAGDRTQVYAAWKEFEMAEYLDDVEVLVETQKHSDKHRGTTLTMTGDETHIAEWDDKQIEKLKFELKKLISPIEDEVIESEVRDSFSITLSFENFGDSQEQSVVEKIEPYPIVKLFDYRISGVVDPNGQGVLSYTNQKARNTVEEKVKIDFAAKTGCGKLVFDIRVYDREKEAIDQLIRRGLKDEKGSYVGKLQARQLLNEHNGIGVYRNGFRIRPLGDSDFDWLKLNEKRVQNPSLRLGTNQVIGYVQIQSEEQSGLEEKSARDGLRENHAYSKLKEISLKVINELESRRFEYRKKAGLSRTAIKMERELEGRFDFEQLRQDIRKKLIKGSVDPKTVGDVLAIIADEEEKTNRIVDDIKEVVAIYQGQATLGKIVNVILHEGRRPLNFFKNEIPNLKFWAKKIASKYEFGALEKIITVADELWQNAEIFVKIFGRLDPLAPGKRQPKKLFFLSQAIRGAFRVFENELEANNIEFNLDCSDEVQLLGWNSDFYTIITNLVDNSLYWMNKKSTAEKNINVRVYGENRRVVFIDYRDSGPGIETHLLESDVIFEPHFTTKPHGMGLGLAIAGEAAARNGLELKAFDSDSGAYFRLQPLMEGNS